MFEFFKIMVFICDMTQMESVSSLSLKEEKIVFLLFPNPVKNLP